MNISASTALIIALLLVPIAVWAERAHPDIWHNRLIATFSEPEPVVVCVDDTLILGTTTTGYAVIELGKHSSACRRSTHYSLPPTN